MSAFIFVTGGVMSSLGKGIAASCIGALLKTRGHSIKMKKLDPYINVDPGTMSPYKHGEVFVMEDGCEADLDFGHYERFTNITCSADDSITTGRIYEKVIGLERKGVYLGSDIQVIPHITNEIKDFIIYHSEDVDFTICEIGGTVGDIESFPYLESLRQLTMDLGKERVICVHLTYLPFLKMAGELKTKPTQHSVKQLQSIGVQPDILLCRSEIPIGNDIKEKLAMFCSVKTDNVITALDSENIYLIPNQYHKEGLDYRIRQHFKMNRPLSQPPESELLGGKPEHRTGVYFGVHEASSTGLTYQEADYGELGKGSNIENDDEFNKILRNQWGQLEDLIASLSKTVTIAVIGKYTKMKDAYISLTQAIMHGGFANDAKVIVKWINAEDGFDEIERQLKDVTGIIVPGGFSARGTDGKIHTIKFARENGIPFLGICLGMQLAVIESCRYVGGLLDATSREFSNDGEMVIDFLEQWEEARGNTTVRKEDENKGGTMRLGSYECVISEDSLAHRIYGATLIKERHRHRYEVALHRYSNVFNNAGIVFSGLSKDGNLAEIMERKDHPFFIATQAHPEFKSKPFSPHPLFAAFIKAAHTSG
ncbi:MAG: CTP synthase [Holosporales bacterium]|jgi:CTP synthase|nr:CTP synthase [Holosporales bacterium]